VIFCVVIYDLYNVFACQVNGKAWCWSPVEGDRCIPCLVIDVDVLCDDLLVHLRG